MAPSDGKRAMHLVEQAEELELVELARAVGIEESEHRARLVEVAPLGLDRMPVLNELVELPKRGRRARLSSMAPRWRQGGGDQAAASRRW